MPETKSRIGTMVQIAQYQSAIRISLGVIEENNMIALVVEPIDPPADVPAEPICYALETNQAKQLHESLGEIIQKLGYGMSAEETSKSFKPN